MADKRDILVRLLGEETVSKMAGRAEKGLDKFGDSLDATEKDAKGLDEQIAEVEGSLKTLAVAFARTSDAADRMDLSKAMRKQQAELRKLTSAKKLLPDLSKAGEDAASGFGASFVARVGPLLAKAPMGAAGSAIGAAIAVPVVSTLGAAVAAGIVGGVGIGGVIGGVALASKDSRVQSAGKALGDAVMGDLEESAGRFVQPTIHGIGIIRSAWADVAGDVDGLFAATSRYVEPLARGVAGAIREIAPGLRDAAEAAGPIIRELGEGLPRIGRALGGLFSKLSDNADEGASAVRFIVMALEDGIGFVGTFVSGLAAMYRTLVEAGTAAADFSYSMYGWMPIIGDKIADNRDRMHELRDAMNKGGDAGAQAGTDISGGLLKAGGAATDATEDIHAFAAAMQELRDQNLEVLNTEIAFERALDETAAAAKKAKGGLDTNTEAGRKNWEVLTALVRDTKAHAAATAERMGSEEAGIAVTEEGRKAFIRSAVQMGLSEGAALDYANQLFGIPAEVDTKSKFHPDNEGVKKWKKTLSGIPRNIFIKAEFDLINNRDVGMALRLGRLSKGGPVTGSGPKGVDSQPYLLAPGEHVLTADEVDAAGGHSGVERLRSALRGGSGGAGVVAAGGFSSGSGGGGVQRVEVVLRVDDRTSPGLMREFVRSLRAEVVNLGGGNVQTALGR